MGFDRHQVWREVAHVYEHLEKIAPEGKQPLTLAYLVGRDEPVPVVVMTSLDPGFPWVRIFTGDERQEYVFAPESYIARVEVSLERREGKAIGFRVESEASSAP